MIIGNYHRLCELLDLGLINLKNVSFLVMDDFYRNRSARLSDDIKRVVSETRVRFLYDSLLFFTLKILSVKRDRDRVREIEKKIKIKSISIFSLDATSYGTSSIIIFKTFQQHIIEF